MGEKYDDGLKESLRILKPNGIALYHAKACDDNNSALVLRRIDLLKGIGMHA